MSEGKEQAMNGPTVKEALYLFIVKVASREQWEGDGKSFYLWSVCLYWFDCHYYYVWLLSFISI